MDYVPIRDAANAEIHETNFMKSVRALLKGIDLTSRAQTTLYGTYILILLMGLFVAVYETFRQVTWQNIVACLVAGSALIVLCYERYNMFISAAKDSEPKSVYK